MNHVLFSTEEPVERYVQSLQRLEPQPGEFSTARLDDWRKWQVRVWQRGVPYGAYLSVGRWIVQSAHESKVYVPRFILDIDRSDLREAHADVIAALDDVLDVVPEEYVQLFFSGSKGFHIEINAAAFGNPVFKSAQDARDVTRSLIRRITTVETDPAVFSPHQSFRVSGSTNFKSDLRKIPLDLEMIRKVSVPGILRDAIPLVPHYEERLQVRDDLIMEVIRAANDILKERVFKPKGRNAGIIEKILEGIEEGEMFGNHSGRNKAAFILACYILESDKNHIFAANSLGIEPKDHFETLKYWYDNRTEGVTTFDLRGPFRSAQRTIQKHARR